MEAEAAFEGPAVVRVLHAVRAERLDLARVFEELKLNADFPNGRDEHFPKLLGVFEVILENERTSVSESESGRRSQARTPIAFTTYQRFFYEPIRVLGVAGGVASLGRGRRAPGIILEDWPNGK